MADVFDAVRKIFESKNHWMIEDLVGKNTEYKLELQKQSTLKKFASYSPIILE